MQTRAQQIESLPVHQRPAARELGRRSEAADNPFRAMSSPIKAKPVVGRVEQPFPPMVTAMAQKQRMILATVDDAAAAAGLHPGMALTHARALVPELDVRDADPHGDRALLHRLALFAVRRWTPTAQVDEPADGLLMDISGVAHLFDGEQMLARHILRFCHRAGLFGRIAIADTVGAAHALARFGKERVSICRTHEELTALGSMPIAALRLDERQRDAAQRLGIERIGELVAMPRAPLSRRLGGSLLRRLDQATGRLAEPLVPVVPFEMPDVERRFAEPIGAAETIARVLADLTRDLAKLLLSRGLGVRMLRLVCERVDRAEQEVVVGTARGTRDVAHMLRLLTMKIETIDPGFGIDSMRLIALRSEPLDPIALTADFGENAPADLASLVDQIVTRLGQAAIYRPTARQSDVPERSIGRVFPLEAADCWSTLWPRPARMLRRPERIENVLAGLPDHPPKRFRWRGVTHTIACADGPERIRGEWWRRPGESHAVRDYFRVENEHGERFWVFRRGDGEHACSGDLSWHIHGIFG